MNWEVWRGFCAAICFQSLIQYAIGKDQYMKVLDATWMDTHWSFWLLGLLFFMFFVPLVERWMKRRDDEMNERHLNLLIKMKEYQDHIVRGPTK